MRNYLLDRRFQLKYTGLLVGIALLLSLCLGAMLWASGSKIIQQGHESVQLAEVTVRQGQDMVRRGEQVIRQSRKVTQVVAMNIAKEYRDEPELAKTFSESTARDETELNREQVELEKDAALLQKRAVELEQRTAQIESQQRLLLIGLIAVLTILVLGVGLAGIMFTHKVAGPIYKMKRLLQQIGEGKLILRERLRKGDELQSFFLAFERMVEEMRRRQKVEIGKVDNILSTLRHELSETGSLDSPALASLEKLREEMQAELE